MTCGMGEFFFCVFFFWGGGNYVLKGHPVIISLSFGVFRLDIFWGCWNIQKFPDVDDLLSQWLTF